MTAHEGFYEATTAQRVRDEKVRHQRKRKISFTPGSKTRRRL